MNRYTHRFQMSASAIVCSVALLSATSLAAEAPSLDEYPQYVSSFAASDSNVRSEAQAAWQTICFTLGNGQYEAQRKAACEKMCDSLSAGQPRESALFILRQLERIALDESVIPLVKLTASEDAEVADAARRALQNNRSPAAHDALVTLLEASTEANMTTRLINSLGYRAQPESVAALAKQLASDNASVQLAAARALTRINSADAAMTVFTAWSNASGAQREELAKAAIVCANGCIRRKDSPQAQSILKSVYAESKLPAIQAAAFQGQLNAAGDETAGLIVKALNGNHVLEQQLAVGQVRQLSDTSIASLLKDLPSVLPTGQAALLTALASRREHSALPAVEQACGSKDQGVKIAALEALGQLGTAAHTELLLSHLTADEEVRSAASRSLSIIFDDGVDSILLKRLAATRDDEKRSELISILSSRRTPGLADIVVQSDDLVSANAETRKQATGILNRLGDENHIAALVTSMTKIPATEHDNVAKTIVSICSRIPSKDNQAGPITDLYESLAPEHRPNLLSVAGRVGGKAAGEFIGSKLSSPSAIEKDAAITALSNWPDDSVSDGLLSIAKSGDTESQRVRALRALARVIVLPSSQHTLDEQLDILKQAITIATRDDERRLILDRVKAIGQQSTVQFVRSYLKTPALRSQAEASLVHLARIRELRQTDPTIRTDLQVILKTSTDQKLKDRCKQFLSDY